MRSPFEVSLLRRDAQGPADWMGLCQIRQSSGRRGFFETRNHFCLESVEGKCKATPSTNHFEEALNLDEPLHPRLVAQDGH
jgi:hypothetical protein